MIGFMSGEISIVLMMMVVEFMLRLIDVMKIVDIRIYRLVLCNLMLLWMF